MSHIGGRVNFLMIVIEKIIPVSLCRNMSCLIMLKLRESVPSCCILQTICTENTNSSHFQVVGSRVDRTSERCTLSNGQKYIYREYKVKKKKKNPLLSGPLQHECKPEQESSCIYKPVANSTWYVQGLSSS